MGAFLHGTVHHAGEDIQAALTADKGVLALWESLTPLARNEFICWIESAKREPTRVKRIAWMVDSLKEGKRRPCCWPGCLHRTDKAPSKSQEWVMAGKR